MFTAGLGWGYCSGECREGREDGWMESGLGLDWKGQCEGKDRFVQELQEPEGEKKKLTAEDDSLKVSFLLRVQRC